MLKLWLIRHGMTEGNKYGRYIGVTDEALCSEGRAFLEGMSYPAPQALYVSPLKRCRETAEILFPEQHQHIVDELAECNFGEFENKNYKELDGNANYQAWVDSGGMLPFPGGESREGFSRRAAEGFQKAVEDCIRTGISHAALVVHGGTIMSVMEAYAGETREFYQWHLKNGFGYEVEIDTKLWQQGVRRLHLLREPADNADER